MEGEQQYYAVSKGLKTGVFLSWADVKPLVTSVSGARYKKFATMSEAEAFVNNGGLTKITKEEKKQPEEKRKRPIVAENIDDTVYTIFTDGAFSSRTKRCGVGVAFDYPLQACAISKRLPDNTTHQKAELDAIVSALWVLSKNNDVREYIRGKKEVHIWTDSQYGCDCFTVFIHGWRRNGWLTSSSQPVKHRKLIEDGAKMLEAMPFVKLRHISEVGLESHQKKVEGMSDLALKVWEGNRRADELASGK
jgi:ribonuclease HI